MTRVGAIDIGSNGIRLLIAGSRPRAAVAAGGSADDRAPEGGDGFEVVVRDRAAVRLGSQTTPGRLDEKAMEQAVEAVQRFAATCREHRTDAVRIVATSAVREAVDGAAFAERASEAVGFPVEIITAAEEARLVHRAMRSQFPMRGGLWVLGDLGGGSLEIALADHDTIHWSESRPMGTVRLLETHGSDVEALRQAIDARLDGFRLLRIAPLARLAGLVMCGGNSRELARMLGLVDDRGPIDLDAPPTETGRLGPGAGAGTGTAGGVSDPAVVSRAQLQDIVSALATMDLAERVERWGLRPDRADVILPAAVVYLRIAERTRQESVHVTDWGLREGLALDLLDKAG